MGGLGSGRPGWRPKAEGFRKLDVNRLHREGALRPGAIGCWGWTVDGETVASIRYRMEQTGLRLIYRSRSYGEEWEDIDYLVPIRYQPCTLGGKRPYFACPCTRNGRYCGRTVAKLYGGRYFLCRHCHGLAYASQSETPRDRLMRKANKMRMRLGGEPGTIAELPDKPKGMWWRTYEREIDKIVDAENMADAHFLLWFSQRFPGQNLKALFG